MKYLIVSDIHLKNKDQFDRESGIISDRTVYKIKRLEEIIKNERPDVLIDCGDLTDTAQPDELIRALYFKTVTPLVPKIILIAGNHNIEKKLMVGTSESKLVSNITIVQPGSAYKFQEITCIGFTRSKDKFLQLCDENKNRFLFTHGDIPKYPLPFEQCFFGHNHQHREEGNCWSIGSLFKDSWAEESHPNYYLAIGTENSSQAFIENPDLKLKTFYSVDEIQGEWDFKRLYFKGKPDILKGVNEKELKEKYGVSTFEYDIERETIIKEKVEDIDAAIEEFIKSKNLTEEELEFGKRFF